MAATDRERPARERILDTASRLFFRDGFRAVGVDTIIAESGIAKMTLYRHFKTKDDLIVAYLERSNEGFWAWFDSASGNGGPKQQLINLFDDLGSFVTRPECLGCMFQLAAADFPAIDHPAHAVARTHKDQVMDRLRGLAEQAHLRDPQTLASGLLLLMDGAFAAARMFGPSNHAADVGRVARALIESRSRGKAKPSGTRL
jgi:AcrR family transcriptional regulator